MADLWFTPALKLTVDAAYTYSDVRAFDTHYFTFGTEPSPRVVRAYSML